MLSLAQLRHQHPRFLFDRVELTHEDQALIITLGYQLEHGSRLETMLKFSNISEELLAQRDLKLIRLWATHIGMVEGLSYWKTSCSPVWEVTVPGITPEQVPFWDGLLKKGLSEFFYIHQINAWEDGFVTFVLPPDDSQLAAPDQSEYQHRALVPVGGGKDSAVTTELLKEAQLSLHTFSVNIYPQLEHVLDVYWQGQTAQNHVNVTRQLDPQLIDLNSQGYLNGHTPFSAMVAFMSTLSAYLYDYSYVPLSNEWSANEGNTIFHGHTINHQYSKTIEFEQLFRDHLAKYLSTTIEYFSFLRPLHELQIAQLFTHYPQYFPEFLSCNRGQKIGTWCGECPKCLFVAIMLSPHMKNEKITEIFGGKDILNNPKLQDIFDQLVGFTEVKSLECVGTRDESRAALALAAQHMQPLPALLSYGWEKLLHETPAEQLLAAAQQLQHSMENQHYIPEELFSFLQEKLKRA